MRLHLAALSFSTLLAAQEPVSPPMPAVEASARREAPQGRTNEVHRHDITWRFDHYYPTGLFANGDPWVIGPVKITAILPSCTEQGGRTLHGAMVDPDPSTRQHGYDSLLFGGYGTDIDGKRRYDSALNVALGIATGTPLELKPGQSLVSVESLLQPGQFSQLRTAAVLTCLAAEPAPGTFRPPYCKGAKPLRFNATKLDFSRLGKLAPLGDVPDLGKVTAQFQRVWLDHTIGWMSRFIHPQANMRDYSRDFTADVGTGALLLQLDLPAEKKRELLVGMVQFGIDTWGNLKAGCSWPGEGGQGSGRKFCILLAGAVLNDAELSAVGKDFPSVRTSADRGTAYFGEDSQTFLVQQTSPEVWNWGVGGYTREHDGLPEWGITHTTELKNDDARWDGNSYRRCCTANAWVGQVLAARIMGLQEAWRHPPLFGYMDRYLQTEKKGEWQRAWDGWHAAMWDAYRSRY